MERNMHRFHRGRNIVSIEIDVKGLSCPVPVVRTRKAMEEHPGEELTISADTRTTCDNITRLAKSNRYSITVSEDGDDFILELTPQR